MSAIKNVFYEKLEPYMSKLRTLKNNKSFKYGVPFFVLMVGGSFGLREWTGIRYMVAQNKSMSLDEAEKLGLKKDKDVTLESTYEEIKQLDIDNWENIRGPRPWEENTTNNNAHKK